jgi:hypothetical protein
MLDAYIIDHLKREEERRKNEEGRRVWIELPLDMPYKKKTPDTEEQPSIIELPIAGNKSYS